MWLADERTRAGHGLGTASVAESPSMQYLVGDVQGCAQALAQLLRMVDFSPSRDHLHVLGDLVNRGPQSLQVLRMLNGFGASASFLLGNHDLHLIAVATGARTSGKRDTLTDILASPERQAWLDWLCEQGQMAALVEGWLTVHAGVAPDWTLQDTLRLGAEVKRALLDHESRQAFVKQMYGDAPARFSEDLQGIERLRAITNVLTRIRFCSADGTLELHAKGGADAAPAGYLPWFAHAQRVTREQPIAFGHWSTLGLIDSPTLLALDTGCVWGGKLTAARVDGGHRELIALACPQVQAP